MKKIKGLFLISLLLAIPLSGSWRYSANFLSAAINLNAGLTATNGSEFTSNELKDSAEIVACTVQFTRAAGAADTVDFAFEASYDNGTSWATFEGVTISIASNHSVISGTSVSVLILVYVPGVSHLRLKSIVNGDGVNNLTAINVSVSY